MKKGKFRLLFLSTLLAVAIIAAGVHGTGGSLLAAQRAQGQDNSSTDANSHYDTTTNDHNLKPDSGPNGAAGQQPNNGIAPAQSGPGTAADNSSQSTGSQNADQGAMAANQSESSTSRAGAPWGWIVGSFIVGLIVGALIFNRPRSTGTMYRDRDDRGDFRRAA